MNIKKPIYLFFVFFFCLSYFKIQAQTILPKTIKVFLDCNNGGDCYLNYIREKYPAITYVRDRLDADVQVINKINFTDNGNEQRILFFIGRNGFEKFSDTLSYQIFSNAQDQERRDEYVKHTIIGLTPFLLHTQLANKLTLNIDFQSSDSNTVVNKDPWNLWVMQLGSIFNFDGNKNYGTMDINNYLYATKETAETKSLLGFDQSYSKQRYVFDDTSKLEFEFKSYEINLSHVKKINEHWGFGLWSNIKNSLFSNYRHRIAFGPRIEYSIFPYKEFNTKRLVVAYDINPVFNSYYDTTIYLKKNEILFNQSISVISSFTKNWGSINIGAFYNNYLDDFRKNFFSINGAVSMRLVKGLNFSVWGNYNLQNNQINLRKGDISIDQLLVKNQELFSSFQYSLGLGVSYRFGSTINNAVCPIFRGLNYSINL